MAYYDRIARQWHASTGYHGGPFKRFVLNDLLLERIGSPGDQSILELGAGNGYFCRLMLRRFAGRPPRRLVITDQSPALLETAKGNLNVPAAEYKVLDVRRAFPFPDGAFHLILATMVFNEVSDRGLQRALHECARVLTSRGQLLMTVAHPEFIRDLARRGQLAGSRNKWTMPAAKGLRLPVYRRSVRDYSRLLESSGFQFEAEDVFADARVLKAKPGLGQARATPLAWVAACVKQGAGPTTVE